MVVAGDQMSLDTNLKDEAGSPPQDGWFSVEHRVRLESLIAKLQTSDTKESVSRYHAMAEGYLLGLLDCYHVSGEHHNAVRQYLHILAVKRLKAIKPRIGEFTDLKRPGASRRL
jgi:hypothetical protein